MRIQNDVPSFKKCSPFKTIVHMLQEFTQFHKIFVKLKNDFEFVKIHHEFETYSRFQKKVHVFENVCDLKNIHDFRRYSQTEKKRKT